MMTIIQAVVAEMRGLVDDETLTAEEKREQLQEIVDTAQDLMFNL